MAQLGDLAHGRSGDKGNHANVAILAYTPKGYDWLDAELSGERVAGYFKDLGVTRVVRYQAPKLLALNFILENALGGGARADVGAGAGLQRQGGADRREGPHRRRSAVAGG